jgi:hypothetical protein
MREAWTWEVQSLDIDGVGNSIAEGETFWFETYGRFWRGEDGARDLLRAFQDFGGVADLLSRDKIILRDLTSPREVKWPCSYRTCTLSYLATLLRLKGVVWKSYGRQKQNLHFVLLCSAHSAQFAQPSLKARKLNTKAEICAWPPNQLMCKSTAINLLPLPSQHPQPSTRKEHHPSGCGQS